MKAMLLRLLICGVVLCGALLGARAASAESEGFLFIVNTTKTEGLDNVCNAAECALSEAIQAANALAGKDTIKFNIPANTDPGCVAATGICTIQPRTALPEITAPLSLNGYSQPGASPNTLAVGDEAKLKIVVKGPGFHDETNAVGLSLKTDNSTVKGLALVDFTDLLVVEGENVQLTGNFFGILPDGVTTGYVVDAVDCTGCVFGASGPENRNLVFGGADFYLSSVQGNYFGTDKTGKAKADANLGPADTDLYIDGGTTVGGRTKAKGNVFGNVTLVVGRGHYGDILFQGNKIGIGADGKVNLGALFQSNSGNRIGFLSNVIAFTGYVTGWHPNVWFSRNKIFANDGLGIDFDSVGVMPNDIGDQDGYQNYPIVTKVEPNILGTTVKGKLNSAFNTTFRIEFFAGPDCDPSGYGEGKTFLGSKLVTTGYPGDVTFFFTTPKYLLKGTYVTATATKLWVDGTPLQTSEFSKCKVAK